MISRAYFGGVALAAGTVVCVCSAQAADLPVRPVPAPVAPVVYAPPVYYPPPPVYYPAPYGYGY